MIDVMMMVTMFAGSLKVCAGAMLVEEEAGHVCGLGALPIRIGCGVSAFNCYKQGCGLLRIPTLPIPELHYTQPKYSEV